MTIPVAENARFTAARLVLATAVTLVASVAAVLIVRAITVSVVNVPAAFTPLRIGSGISLTVLGVLAAGVGCLILARVAKRPVSLFRRLAPVVLVVSFAPDIAIWALHSYSHTASAATVIPLMIMHLAVAGLCLVLFPALGAVQTSPAVGTTSALDPRLPSRQ